jgi:dTDP-4-dehydrorhamnose 3,5-epimerase
MRRVDTRIDGPILIEPVVHGDPRGFFQETYRKADFAELGVHDDFVQDNHSRSRLGVLRGMHFQPSQAKLVRCARGSILEWEGFPLDDESHRELYVPDGFAHGFVVTSELADVVYKVSTYYDPDAESGFRYDDPQVGIEWPAGIELQVSDRDRTAPLLSELGLNA